MLQALVAGEVHLAIGDLTTSKSWIDSGRVIPLAVLSAKRTPSLPNVPTLVEEGVLDDPADFWFGSRAPQECRPLWLSG
jgi:tripartite-type tricarboxylate transporter receptor subunit TctC